MLMDGREFLASVVTVLNAGSTKGIPDTTKFELWETFNMFSLSGANTTIPSCFYSKAIV